MYFENIILTSPILNANIRLDYLTKF